MKWRAFDESKGYAQQRPPINKWVAVKLEAKPGQLHGLAIGYRRDAAGDRSCPYFVVPGIVGKVVEWCDCLPENFDPCSTNEKQNRPSC